MAKANLLCHCGKSMGYFPGACRVPTGLNSGEFIVLIMMDKKNPI